MNERPGPSDYTAPSPADAPTTPGRAGPDAVGPGVGRSDADPVDTVGPGTSGELVADPARPPVYPDADGPGRPPISEALTEPERPVPSGLLPTRPERSRMSATVVGLILGAVVLVFLLVFILQNPEPARVMFLGLDATLPLGIWLLFSAIAGVLLLAIPGLGRFFQWRRSVPRRPTTSSRWGRMRR